MEAVSRMSRIGQNEEKESSLPVCLGAQVLNSAECKVRWMGGEGMMTQRRLWWGEGPMTAAREFSRTGRRCVGGWQESERDGS